MTLPGPGAVSDPGPDPDPGPNASPDPELVSRLRAAGCVYAEDEARLLTEAARSPGELEAMVGQRVSGLPLEQVVGWAEFCGLRLHVEPGVFVPRRRTELLAHEALRLARNAALDHAPVAVDLCCGAGAIAAVLVDGLVEHRLVEHGLVEHRAELHASDVDPVAVRCARRNLTDRVEVHEGDLAAPLPARLRGRVDVLVANVPYVPTAEIDLLPSEARLHEPRVTLDGGEDGLRVLARVADLATGWLAPGGSVLCETSGRQAGTARQILADHGLTPRLVVDDELGATVVVGTRAGG